MSANQPINRQLGSIVDEVSEAPRTVRARTSTAALALVREQLGDEAVVLDTKTVRDPDTGLKMVELTASADAQGASESPARRMEPEARSPLFRLPSPGFRQGTRAPEETDVLATVVDRLEGLREDIQHHRQESARAFGEIRHLRGRLAELQDVLGSLTAEHALMREHGIPSEWVPPYRRLVSVGIDPTLAEEIIREVQNNEDATTQEPKTVEQALAASLRDRIRIKPILGQAISPPVLAFVGPGGAGKTTMLSKVAAHAVLKGMSGLGLVVSEDAGSLDSLSRVAAALGIPITEAHPGPGGLSRTLCAMQGDGVDLVLVDTPTYRVGCEEENRAIWRELTTIPSLEIVAVLSATTRDVDLDRTARDLARMGFHRFAFTHMEEAMRVGALLTLVETTGRPISALSYGISIPDSLILPDASSLAAHIIRPQSADRKVS